MRISLNRVCFMRRCFCSSVPKPKAKITNEIKIGNDSYQVDKLTNVNTNILSKIGRNLHNQEGHPLNLIKQKIVNFFHTRYLNRLYNPLFASFDDFSPVVSLQQNFDSLLVPKDHVSRSPRDTYYINHEFLLRAHTSAHQSELLKMGLDNFLVFGDVYRRDSVDATHCPVFHQVEGVRIFSSDQLFQATTPRGPPADLKLFEDNLERTPLKQERHTNDTAQLLELHLKKCLADLAVALFGKIEMRWVDVYFPFTHPSWELEIKFQGEWMEVLGSGIMEQEILNEAGATDRVGWAFGLGLERLAMKLYHIPDIRLFWSNDSGFLSQFEGKQFHDAVKFKPFSRCPPLKNDISFWIPDGFSPTDFYDVVRSVGGNLVEQVKLIDEFKHPKTGRISNCYRIVYRSMERTLTQQEISQVHREIESEAERRLGVELRT